MRILFTSLAATALIAGSAFAHDHGKKKKPAEPAPQTEQHQGHGSGTSYGSESSYGSGTHGDEMKQNADDHAAHGTMSHGKDQMDHGNMDHGNMDHGNMDHGNMDHGNMDHGDGHMMGSKTMPADGSVLKHSPKMIGVNFGHKMSVEAITISTLTGEMIELDVSETGETSHVMVKAPELQADEYIVDWRARGHDGHVMSGSFAFTVE